MTGAICVHLRRSRDTRPEKSLPQCTPGKEQPKLNALDSGIKTFTVILNSFGKSDIVSVSNHARCIKLSTAKEYAP